MAGYYALKRWCDRQNEEGRNVRVRDRVRIGSFWEHAAGSFLISGGDARTRSRILLEEVDAAIAERSMPTVILNGSPEFEQDLIRRFRGGGAGRLLVSSRQYRNYQFFHGMAAETAGRYLLDAARELGYDGDPYLRSYIQAFLSVLGRICKPNLQEMLHLSRYSDMDIADLGRRCGAPQPQLDILRSRAGSGELFRELLEELARIFGILTTEDCETGCSILAWANSGDMVLLINTRSSRPAVVNRYFAAELMELGERRQFRLILNEVQLKESDGLLELVREAFSSGGLVAGVCAGSVAAVIADDDFLGSFPVKVILAAGSESAADKRRLLAGFHQYMHYEVTAGGGKPPGAWGFHTSTDWHIINFLRDRVMPEEIDRGITAVLAGDEGGRVTLARRLVFAPE